MGSGSSSRTTCSTPRSSRTYDEVERPRRLSREFNSFELVVDDTSTWLIPFFRSSQLRRRLRYFLRGYPETQGSHARVRQEGERESSSPSSSSHARALADDHLPLLQRDFLPNFDIIVSDFPTQSSLNLKVRAILSNLNFNLLSLTKVRLLSFRPTSSTRPTGSKELSRSSDETSGSALSRMLSLNSRSTVLVVRLFLSSSFDLSTRAHLSPPFFRQRKPFSRSRCSRRVHPRPLQRSHSSCHCCCSSCHSNSTRKGGLLVVRLAVRFRNPSPRSRSYRSSQTSYLRLRGSKKRHPGSWTGYFRRRRECFILALPKCGSVDLTHLSFPLPRSTTPLQLNLPLELGPPLFEAGLDDPTRRTRRLSRWTSDLELKVDPLSRSLVSLLRLLPLHSVAFVSLHSRFPLIL